MDEEVSATERLMTTLISKMESMDSDLQSLKRENAMLRSDEGVLLKANDSFTNEEIHLMSWEEIHDMADQAKTTEV